MGKSFNTFAGMDEQPVILFDGVCNLCNGAVNFVIKRDKKSRLKFAPLQSNEAKKIAAPYDLGLQEMSSFVFVENNKCYLRSTAALRVCRHLDGLWPLMYGFILVPRVVRDGIYDWIAKNRYRWFGKKQQCMIPTAQIRSRFLNKDI